MTFSYQRGDTIKFYWTGSGLAQVEFGIRSHSVKIEAILHEITTTRMSGGTGRIGGKIDATGTVNAAADLDELPHGFSIYPGLSGVAFFGISPTRGVELPCIVGSLNYEVAVDGYLQTSFEVSMNILAGTLIMP